MQASVGREKRLPERARNYKYPWCCSVTIAMNEDERYHWAKKRVEDIRGFYTHLGVYIVINVLLLTINLVTSPNALWFYWVTIFWGVGIAFHAMGVFVWDRFFGREWEERKVREIMEREEQK